MEPSQWFYRDQDQPVGPVSREEIINRINLGLLSAESYVWAEGMQDWLPVGQIPAFAGFVWPVGTPARPASVTVFGTLNIIFGSLALLCSPFGIIGLLVPQTGNPFPMTGAIRMMALVGYGIGFIFAIVLLASGIGLLKQRSWARQTAYLYGWAALIWGVLSLVINLSLMMPSMGNVPEETAPAVIGGFVGGMCGGLISLIYPVLLIVFMRKPHVIAACST